MPRKKQKPETNEATHSCAVSGCAEGGQYPAPRTRDNLRDYQWFCLDHVREYNRSWDYFDGMNTEQIENFMQDSLTGHRPTWEREDAIRQKPLDYLNALDEGLTRFFRWNPEEVKRAERERLPPKERKALAVLDLDDRVTIQQLKAHYRKLVKRHHPDLHGGSTTQEERFKQINAAYTYLLGFYGGK